MNPILLTLLLAAVAPDAAPVEVALLDGRTVAGEVVSWNRDGVTIKSTAESEQFPADQLLNLTWKAADGAADKSATFLELLDGSRFRITDFSTHDHTATVASPYVGAPLEIRTERIRSVELQPRTEAAAAVWQELEHKETAGDVLVVAKREGKSFDYLTGVAGDLTADQAQFQWEGEQMAVKRSKAAAILYYHKQADRFPDAVCELTAADGSRIPAVEVEFIDGRLHLTTPAGVKLELAIADLRHADFSAGKLAYLSDLKPIEVKWTPRIAAPAGASTVAAFGMPRNDQSFAGSALSLVWKDDPLPARRACACTPRASPSAAAPR